MPPLQGWANCDAFVLVGAMNPCPCVYYGDEQHEYTCTMGMAQRYQKRISGPLLDLMALCANCAGGIHLDVRSVPYQKLSSLDSGVKLRLPSACVWKQAARLG